MIRLCLLALATPISHGFVRQENLTFGHELFGIAIPDAEAEVEPDTMADDFRWQPVAFIWIGCWGVHSTSVPHRAEA